MRDTVRHVILPIWNTWYFLTLYANAAGTTGTFRTDQTDVLDRYLLGELNTLVRSMTVTMDDYDLYDACQNVVQFIETLSNCYIRRSRAASGRRSGRYRHVAHPLVTLSVSPRLSCRS